MVDADADLVGALSERLSYEVQVHHGERVEKKSYTVHAALSPVSQLEDVLAAVDSSILVTTSVRHANLPKVAAVLHQAFARLSSEANHPHVIACENVRSASTELADLIGDEQTVSLDRGYFLNAEVDRICQTGWSESLSVKTEPYYEWSVETPSKDLALNTVSFVADIDSYFDRKRYLVNTVADAIGFLGAARGHRYLHEAASDREILARLEPAVEDLMKYLELQHGFAPQSLRDYYGTTLRRLQNKGIARTLDTVARDLERKLGAQERFVAPALALCERGLEPQGLASLTRTIIDLHPYLKQKTWSAFWGDDAPARRFANLVEQARVG